MRKTIEAKIRIQMENKIKKKGGKGQVKKTGDKDSLKGILKEEG